MKMAWLITLLLPGLQQDVTELPAYLIEWW